MGFDRKYGVVTTEHGEIPDDEPVVVFRARDALLPALLAEYQQMCEAAGSPERHRQLISESLTNVESWQRANPGKVRTPDSERSREWLER
jgi:hypothetical protein